MVSVSVPDSLVFFFSYGMTVMLTLRFLVRLWFKSLSGSLLIILYNNHTRNRSVNITVIPKKKKKKTTRESGTLTLTITSTCFDLWVPYKSCVSTCVNDRVTCLQLMPAYAEHVSYVEYVEKFSTCWKFLDVLGVQRRMPAYYDVCQRALNVYQTYP